MQEAPTLQRLALGLLVALALGRARADAPDAAASPAESAPASAADAGELDALERELSQVMDELVAARARTGVLSRALFRTELAVEIVRRADALRLERLTLRLDGVPVHEATALGEGRVRLFGGHVAPGMHELAVEIVERAKHGAAYGYVRTERYRIDVKKERRTRVELIVRDDSDMAEQAAEGDDGSYEVQTELRVTRERVRE